MLVSCKDPGPLVGTAERLGPLDLVQLTAFRAAGKHDLVIVQLVRMT
jgi:hypothetical protein